MDKADTDTDFTNIQSKLFSGSTGVTFEIHCEPNKFNVNKYRLAVT